MVLRFLWQQHDKYHIAKAFGSKLTAISLVAVDPFSGVDFYYISPVVKDYFVEARANAEKHLRK